jgi:uncharacterized protein (DUF2062 family)
MKRRYLRLVRRAFRSLRHRKLRHRPWWRTLTRPLMERSLWIPCRDSVAVGLAFGLFFSVMLMPFQTVPAALLSMRFRGNVPIAMAACWISNPFTAPPLLWAQFKLGYLLREVLGVPMPHFLTDHTFNIQHVGQFNAANFILGMFALGVILALSAFPIVHLFSAIMPHHLPVRKRRERMMAAIKGAVS